jgi:hypothetical protein
LITRLLCLAGLLAANPSIAADGPDLGHFVKTYPSDGKGDCAGSAAELAAAFRKLPAD